MKAVGKSTLKISKNKLKCKKVRFTRIMHEEKNLLDYISNVWMSECQILKSFSEASIECRVRYRFTRNREIRFGILGCIE